MSIRHLKELQEHFGNDKNWIAPIPQVLALPDDLVLCDEPYDPCAFGTPGGAPRQLGPQNPVVVDGKFTYVFAQDGKVAAYFKMARRSTFKLLIFRSFSNRGVGVAITSTALDFDTLEDAELAFDVIKNAMPDAQVVRLYK